MKQTLLLGVGKMILLVHSLKISSQISIILWFFGPSPYNINIFEIKDIHRIKNLKKTCFYRKKYKKTKYVLNNYGGNHGNCRRLQQQNGKTSPH